MKKVFFKTFGCRTNQFDTQVMMSKLKDYRLSLDDIDSDDFLFNEGLGLDSIDALELGLAIRKKYGIRIDAEKDDVQKIFASVATLAKFIESEQVKK